MVPQIGEGARAAGRPAQLAGDADVRAGAVDALGVEVPRPVAEPPSPGLPLHLGTQDGQQEFVRPALEQVAGQRVQQVVDGPAGGEREAELREPGDLRFEFHSGRS